MRAARVKMAKQPILMAHRYLTREITDVSENFIQLTPDEFSLRQQAGFFWVTWRSHNTDYALGCEVLTWLAAGYSVVVNGSRAALPVVIELCRQDSVNLVPVWVHCDTEVLAQRLRDRGRETEEQIQQRLTRAVEFSPPSDAVVIDNSGSLSASVEQFVALLMAG